MKFLGNIVAKPDAKGRITIPAQYRRQLEQAGDVSLVLRVDRVTMCAKLYTSAVWDELDADFRAKLNPWDKNDQRLYRQFSAMAEALDIDSSGRILLSRKTCDSIGLKGDVLFVGMGSYFEVWDADNFYASLDDDADFDLAMQLKMGNHGSGGAAPAGA